MATWTLYLMQTPLNTLAGQSGVVTPLTLASGLSMSYKVDDIDSLSFTLPGRHYQTGMIRESFSDIIAWRDAEVMQRFRVTSMQVQGAGANVTVSVTCAAYREVVNSWMFHDSVDVGSATLAAATDLVTTAAPHGLEVGESVVLGIVTGTASVASGQRYYARTVPSATTLTLAATPGGPLVDITGNATVDAVYVMGDALDYPGANDPTEVAWLILDEGQRKPGGDLNCSRGAVPVLALAPQSYEAVVTGEPVNPTDAAHYFAPGESRMDGINKIANLDVAGFEWAIEPDEADPWSALKLNTWNRGGRFTAPSGRSDFVLSEATMASWSVVRNMADYANVLRVSPNSDTVDGTVGGYDAPVWRPPDRDPANTELDPQATARGRWEMDITSTQFNPDLVAAYADEQLLFKQEHARGISCTLLPGRWEGKADFWVGDSLRLILQIPLVDDDGLPTGDYLVDQDTLVRAVGINITVGTGGTEEISLDLDTVLPSLRDVLYRLQSDVKTLKRR